MTGGEGGTGEVDIAREMEMAGGPTRETGGECSRGFSHGRGHSDLRCQCLSTPATSLMRSGIHLYHGTNAWKRK